MKKGKRWRGEAMRVNPSILLLTFPLFYDNTEYTLYDIRMACYFCTIYEYGQHYNSLHTFLIYLYDNRHTISPPLLRRVIVMALTVSVLKFVCGNSIVIVSLSYHRRTRATR